MGRRKNKEENLSNETPEVQEELLKDLVEEPKEEESKEEVTAGLSQIVPDSEKKFEKGAKCKIHKDVSNDIVGRKIMESVKNYTYTIMAARSDGHCTINCLAYTFTLSNKDLDLV